jgi:hypothetical protein
MKINYKGIIYLLILIIGIAGTALIYYNVGKCKGMSINKTKIDSLSNKIDSLQLIINER